MACLISDYEIITPNHLQLLSIILCFVFVFVYDFFIVHCVGFGVFFRRIIVCVKPKIIIEFVNEISSLSVNVCVHLRRFSDIHYNKPPFKSIGLNQTGVGVLHMQ